MDNLESIYRAFGRAVANRRKQLQLTQLDLAKRVGLSRGSIAHIEKGTQKVFLHHVYGITEALELSSVHELLATQRVLDAPSTHLKFRISADGRLSRDLRDQVRTAVGTTIKGTDEE
ncbi:helix-turn-helix domain-containing protein [Alteripontixanthobacter maritimus]|uniref:helix-turn-helix domain-containing protein n=1 Tax=Alteripontixanthobacter maritimus TaxID=2161824 RepID=UPI000E1BF897|nr:helix-turn-helix domain-containing protein [Alteripontixanthobacter maritimus]